MCYFQYGYHRRMVNSTTKDCPCAISSMGIIEEGLIQPPKIVHVLYCLGQSYGSDQEGRQVVWAWWNPWTAPFEVPWVWSQRNWDPSCCATYLWPELCRETWIHGSLQLWSRTLVIIKGWLYYVLINSPFGKDKILNSPKKILNSLAPMLYHFIQLIILCSNLIPLLEIMKLQVFWISKESAQG